MSPAAKPLGYCILGRRRHLAAELQTAEGEPLLGVLGTGGNNVCVRYLGSFCLQTSASSQPSNYTCELGGEGLALL